MLVEAPSEGSAVFVDRGDDSPARGTRTSLDNAHGESITIMNNISDIIIRVLKTIEGPLIRGTASNLSGAL